MSTSNTQYLSRGTCNLGNATQRTGSTVTYTNATYKPTGGEYYRTCANTTNVSNGNGNGNGGWKQTVQQFPENTTEALNKPAVFGWSWCFWLSIILGIIVLALLIGWFVKAVSNSGNSNNYNQPYRYCS